MAQGNYYICTEQIQASDIRIEEIKESECSPLVWYIFGRRLAGNTECSDRLFLLQLEGKNIAIFDKDGFLLPMAEFPVQIEEDMERTAYRDFRIMKRIFFIPT